MAAAGLLMSSPAAVAQKAPSQRSAVHTSCFWGAPRRGGIRTRAPASVRFAAGRPQAFGPAGFWGPGCAPGNMNYMNRSMADVMQQLERDFSAAAHQARQQRAQHENSGNDGGSASQQRARSRGQMGLPVDMIETDDAVWSFADLPGLEKSDLQIKANAQDRTIVISGERTQPSIGDDDDVKSRNLQRLFGKFSHTITLPKDADPQLISAKVDRGVLRVKVLKQTTPEPELQNVPIDD